jgi:FAD/FMN-containing dehydrogenase
MATITHSSPEEFLAPGDPGYHEARRAWNLTVDQRPTAVAVARTAKDVVEAVRLARSRGLRIAPQGTGHGAAPLEPLDGVLLLKTSRMRRVQVDPAAGTARVEAGAVWQDVTVPAAEHGLAALAGSSPNVGVTGYTLGGGIGWLARRHGLAANSVTAAELVTAPASRPHPSWARRFARTRAQSKKPSRRGAPTTTTTTSARPRPARTPCSRTKATSGCARSRPPMTRTRRSSPSTPSGHDRPDQGNDAGVGVGGGGRPPARR